MITTNQYIKLINDFFEAHAQINTTLNGDEFNFNADSDIVYPVAHSEYKRQSTTSTNIATQFLITIGDIFDSNINNAEVDIWSDTNQIAMDFIDYLSNQDGDFIIVENVAVEPFKNGNVDRIAGVSFTITFNQWREANDCIIPTIVKTTLPLQEIPLPPQDPNRVFDVDAQLYITNGSVINPTTQKNIDDLVKRLKLNHLYTSIKAMWIKAGENGIGPAGRLNLVNPIDTDAAFRLTFPNGVGNDGTDNQFYFDPNQYADTKIPMYSLESKNYGMFLFKTIRDNDATSASMSLMGAADANYQSHIDTQPQYTAAYSNKNDLSIFGMTQAGSVFNEGLYMLNVKNGHFYYSQGGNLMSATVSNTQLPSSNIFINGFNDSGTASHANRNRVGFAGVFEDINNQQMPILISILNKYAVAQNIKTVNNAVFYGDSITVGAFATGWDSSDKSNTWVGKLLDARYTPYDGNDSQNYGVVSMCLQNVNDNTNSLEYVFDNPNYIQYGSRIVPYNDTFKNIFLAFGTNDCFQYNDENNPITNYTISLQHIFDRLISVGWPVEKMVMVNGFILDYSIQQNPVQARHLSIVSQIENFCAANNIKCIDTYNYMVNNGGLSLLSDDGVHPNDDGHAAIAECILANLS